MNSPLLEKISQPSDLKKLSGQQVEQLCADIREFLLENVSKTGGHLASNLGAVELTVASSLWAVSAPAASSSAGRRLFAVSAAASAAALATCASVRRAVSAVISVRRLSFRAPLRSLSWVRRSSASFSAASSAASCCPAASMEAATARWRSNAAAASVLSC